jgi:4-aminobutyrate aminotransferase/(S)-3-amino-2-methylpropionate transaminase
VGEEPGQRHAHRGGGGQGEIMDKAGPSSIGGTYIGNPVSCAAALATLKYMEEVDINAKGRHVGK